MGVLVSLSLSSVVSALSEGRDSSVRQRRIRTRERISSFPVLNSHLRVWYAMSRG